MAYYIVYPSLKYISLLFNWCLFIILGAQIRF